jgi:hypothetical protein
MEPSDLIPVLGIIFVAGCTIVGVAGAWAMGRARGIADAARQHGMELDTHSRIERMERSLATVSEEIERLGEVQRFALKVIADKAGVSENQISPQGRVITPH